MEKRPAWKQPQSLVLIAGGGVIALATLYLLVTTWAAPAPTATALPTGRVIVDENTLVAANAEPQGGTPAENVAIGGMGPIPPPATVEPAAGAKPETERFNPNEIIAEAQRTLDESREPVDQEPSPDELDKPEPDGPK